MQYINIAGWCDDPEGLKVSCSDTPSKDGVSTPVIPWDVSSPALVDGAETEWTRRVGHLLSELYDEEATAKAGVPVSGQIFQPDPWLVALAWLIAQGCIQNGSWDAIKLVVVKAITIMQESGVAPSSMINSESSRKVEFKWSGYLDMGRLGKLYAKLKVRYKIKIKTKRD